MSKTSNLKETFALQRFGDLSRPRGIRISPSKLPLPRKQQRRVFANFSKLPRCHPLNPAATFRWAKKGDDPRGDTKFSLVTGGKKLSSRCPGEIFSSRLAADIERSKLDGVQKSPYFPFHPPGRVDLKFPTVLLPRRYSLEDELKYCWQCLVYKKKIWLGKNKPDCAKNKWMKKEEGFSGEIFQIPDKFYGPPPRSLRAAMKDQGSRCWLGRGIIFISLNTYSIVCIGIPRDTELGWPSRVHTDETY